MSKLLSGRIEHAMLLIEQLNAELLQLSAKMPSEQANMLIQQLEALKIAMQQFNYALRKQEDVEQQKQNEPLIIKEDDEC